jgi:hypothetical protein
MSSYAEGTPASGAAPTAGAPHDLTTHANADMRLLKIDHLRRPTTAHFFTGIIRSHELTSVRAESYPPKAFKCCTEPIRMGDGQMLRTFGHEALG